MNRPTAASQLQVLDYGASPLRQQFGERYVVPRFSFAVSPLNLTSRVIFVKVAQVGQQGRRLSKHAVPPAWPSTASARRALLSSEAHIAMCCSVPSSSRGAALCIFLTRQHRDHRSSSSRQHAPRHLDRITWVGAVVLYYPTPSSFNKPHAVSAIGPGETAIVNRLIYRSFADRPESPRSWPGKSVNPLESLVRFIRAKTGRCGKRVIRSRTAPISKPSSVTAALFISRATSIFTINCSLLKETTWSPKQPW